MLKEFKFVSNANKRLFLASDSHWRHDRPWIVQKRGFSTIEEHDEELIKVWNSRVRVCDDVIFCGDWIFRADAELCKKYIDRLNGHVYAIFGNHTSGIRQLFQELVFKEFARKDIEVYPMTYNNKFTFVGDYMKGYINNVPFVASHFPFRIWDSMQHNAVHFSGHSHSNDRESNPDYPDFKRLDIGFDNFGGPVAFEDAMEILDRKRVVLLDHH